MIDLDNKKQMDYLSELANILINDAEKQEII